VVFELREQTDKQTYSSVITKVGHPSWWRSNDLEVT